MKRNFCYCKKIHMTGAGTNYSDSYIVILPSSAPSPTPIGGWCGYISNQSYHPASHPSTHPDKFEISINQDLFENKSCSTTWVDPKTAFEPNPYPQRTNMFCKNNEANGW